MSIDTTEAIPDEDAPAIPVVDVSPSALQKVLGIRDEEDEPETLGLRIDIIGTRGTEYTYDLAFEVLAEAEEGDDVTDIGGLMVWVPADSIDKLRGSVLDLPSASGQAGLVIRNPNRADPMAAAKDLVLTGTVPEKVQQLLDESINPSLASHGGFATLVGVDGSTAYVNMGGGCQGCAMSAATLRDGIQAAILESVPEITEVVDATDHSAGENPFY